MKVAKLQSWFVKCPVADSWKPFWGPGRINTTSITVTKVTADEGLVGWGTSFNFSRMGVPDTRNAVRLQGELGPQLIGKDIFEFEGLTQMFETFLWQGINPWSVDLALWDIVGKAAGQPVYKLLGGYRDRVPVYASCTNAYGPEERVEALRHLIDDGWKAAKIHLAPSQSLADSLRLITPAREAVGDRLRIAVDTHQNDNFRHWGLQGALSFGRELDRMGNFLWMEDCLPRNDYASMQQLSAQLATPVSCGGIEASLTDIGRLLSTDCLDQIQPGPGCNGSMWTMRKIVTLCEVYFKNYSPHTWSALDTVAGLHIAAATPACNFLEMHYDPPAQPVMLINLLLKEPIQFNKEDGTCSVPQAPGWGVEVDEELVERYCER